MREEEEQQPRPCSWVLHLRRSTGAILHVVRTERGRWQRQHSSASLRALLPEGGSDLSTWCCESRQGCCVPLEPETIQMLLFFQVILEIGSREATDQRLEPGGRVSSADGGRVRKPGASWERGSKPGGAGERGSSS